MTVLVQTIGLPVLVAPRAPAPEQNAPGITPVRVDVALDAVIGAGSGWEVGVLDGREVLALVRAACPTSSRVRVVIRARPRSGHCGQLVRPSRRSITARRSSGETV